MSRQDLHDLALAARAARTGVPVHDLALFSGLLREIGVAVSPASSQQAVRALGVIRLDEREDVRIALRGCLSGSRADQSLFDAVFDVFWQLSDPEQLALTRAPEHSGAGDAAHGTGTGSAEQIDGDDVDGPDAEAWAGRATYGRTAGSTGNLDAVGRRDVDALASRLARVLAGATGRRWGPAEPGDRVDLRASIRENLRFGGELLVLRHTRRRRDRARLVVLCDVSSSMRPSLPLFLAFVHALTRSAPRVESAVFNVDTVSVTEIFRRMPLRPALRWLARQQVALSGGTRIGHCLHAFLDDLETQGMLGPRTVALILSDGWDVGESELLADQMRRLRTQVGRVVWCDPHASACGFDPQVDGLRTALPFIDDYLDFSSAASLAGLVDHLAGGLRRLARPAGTVPSAA